MKVVLGDSWVSEIGEKGLRVSDGTIKSRKPKPAPQDLFRILGFRV